MNAYKPKFTSNIDAQTNNLWDQHPTWTTGHKHSSKQLRTGGEIHQNKNIIRPSMPRPAESTHLATQRLTFGVPNASRILALTFGICEPAPGFQFGAKGMS